MTTMRKLILAMALSSSAIFPAFAAPPADGQGQPAGPSVKTDGGLPPVFETLKRKERGEASPPLPPSMARYGKAFDYAGKLGGLDVWSISGGPVFAVLPDGKTVVMGLAIAPDGKDQTPDYTGAGSVDVEAFMRAAAGERERGEKAREALKAARQAELAQKADPVQKLAASPHAGYDPAKAAAALEAMVKSGDAAALDPRVKALLEDVLKGAAARPDEKLTAAAEDAPAAAPPAQPAPESAAPRGDGPAQAVIVPQPVKPEPAGRPAEAAGRPGSTDKSGSVDKSGSATAPAKADPSARAAAQSAAAEPVNADDAKALRAALESVAWRTSWIVVGNRDPKTPVIYVFADPTCPHCVAGFGRLREFVDQGKLQLRVVLTPYLSQESLDLATAVMRADDPGAAFWKLETERAAHNRNGIAPMPAKTYLDPERLAALDRNIKWFSEHSLAGTPFYLWREEAGVRVLYGEPDVRNFYGALPDDVIGAEGEWRPAPEKKTAPAAENRAGAVEQKQ